MSCPSRFKSVFVCDWKLTGCYFNRRYLSITVKGKKYENLIWYYQYPTHESAAVEGLISFYRKFGIEIWVDGVKI